MPIKTNIETRAGSPLRLKGIEIIPFKQVVRVQPRGLWGVLLWDRPSAVAVRFNDGTEEVLQIRDITRLAQVAILGFSLVGSLLAWLLFRARK